MFPSATKSRKRADNHYYEKWSSILVNIEYASKNGCYSYTKCDFFLRNWQVSILKVLGYTIEQTEDYYKISWER